VNPRVTKKTVLNQPSWRVASAEVEAFVTELGGHLSPVTFDRRSRRIQPYQVAPWATEKMDALFTPVETVLRGDFFCMPFGVNLPPYRGEKHILHGETANARWSFHSLTQEDGQICLRLRLRTRVRKGQVDKSITLVDGHNAVYCRHVISQMSGPMNFGHHATLKFPDEPESGTISTSRFAYGEVFPEPLEDPAHRGYSILKPGAEIKTLARVPTITGESTDLTRFPARRGFEDVIQLLSDPDLEVGWTAVTFPKQRYVWFGLKDPKVLTGTLFWISNGGRHYPPWNGRHINVMGLEEITSYFFLGLSASAKKNPFTERGIRTACRLNAKRPLVVNYIMAVAAIPSTFDRVKRIDLISGGVRLVARSGRRVEVPLDTAFLRSRG